jgi:ribose transport system substrate-binding protein
VAENLLQAHPELDGIFAANDEMALGALEAVAAAGGLDRIRIIGFDAIPDAISNIRAGRLVGSVAQFPSEMGRLGVRHAVELLQDGVPPPSEILTRVEIISSSNVDEFAPDISETGRPVEEP